MVTALVLYICSLTPVLSAPADGVATGKWAGSIASQVARSLASQKRKVQWLCFQS
ncbi:hypothetical protein IF1G_06424 [Cordyceps javanica]|uniref:Uncharacterized protein n=1 Tax=Cordyceps javanica TaxID=43265 RepID=A0A545V168_9HYPO|nr:hypothetical protein IF1G_06424 [Cordyceps javanica]